MSLGLGPKKAKEKKGPKDSRSYCSCYDHIQRETAFPSCSCICGEENSVCEWKWKPPPLSRSTWVRMTEDRLQVTLHPYVRSKGTVAVRGDTRLIRNNHYYFEVKVLSQPYGTDVMVGVASRKVNLVVAERTYISLLGQDGRSYGLSYTGIVLHNMKLRKDTEGFCRGTIVGVRVDLWLGMLEYYINRKPQGVSFYNMRCHQHLYPTVCATAAFSVRLIHATSWRASLLVDAAKILASSVKGNVRETLPPGLRYTADSYFWLTLPTAGHKNRGRPTEDMEPSLMDPIARFFPERPSERIVTWITSEAPSNGVREPRLKIRPYTAQITRYRK